MSSSEDEGAGAQQDLGQDPPPFSLDLLRDVLLLEGLDGFLREYWEPGKIYATQLSPEVLDQLMEGFYDGEPERVVQSCRTEQNYRMEADTPGDSGTSLTDLTERGKTLVLPFCFSPSAFALREAFVSSALGEHANDIECGVYLSRAGGEPTEWHLDNNHNITIQLTGQKDWHIIEGGDPNPVGKLHTSCTPYHVIPFSAPGALWCPHFVLACRCRRPQPPARCTRHHGIISSSSDPSHLRQTRRYTI